MAKRVARLIMMLVLAGTLSALGCDAFDRSHKLFTAQLKKYAGETGVHYRRWQTDQAGLDAYLKSLSDLTRTEYDKLGAADREAFWLNVYDALTIKAIVTHYPIQQTISYYPPSSVRQIPNVWENQSDVAGRKVSLGQIEHDILRREIRDTRTHFAVSCGAAGCGPTPRRAYTAGNLQQELNAAKEKFLNDPKNIQVDSANKTLTVSQVFKWFPLDFAPEAGFAKIPFPPPSDDEIVLNYLAKNGPQPVRDALADTSARSSYKVVYLDFDWTLNDADATAVH